jgi:hypothetical protein
MTYLLVKWKTASPDVPCVMYSELDDQRMERRKIDVYADGRWGFADEHEEIGGSGLGEASTPTVDCLNADPEYEAEAIDKEEFEKLWSVRRNARIMTPFPLDNGGGEPS